MSQEETNLEALKRNVERAHDRYVKARDIAERQLAYKDTARSDLRKAQAEFDTAVRQVRGNADPWN